MKKFKEQLSQPHDINKEKETALDFWIAQGDSAYPSLKPIALDLLSL